MDMWVLQVNHHHNCCHIHHHHHQNRHHTWVINIHHWFPYSHQVLKPLLGPFLTKTVMPPITSISNKYLFSLIQDANPLVNMFHRNLDLVYWCIISFCICIYIWKVDGLLVLQHKHLCAGGGSLCHLSCYRHKGESQDSQNEPFFVFLVNVLYLLRAWTSNLHKMSSISLKYCSLCFCCCLQKKTQLRYGTKALCHRLNINIFFFKI